MNCSDYILTYIIILFIIHFIYLYYILTLALDADRTPYNFTYKEKIYMNSIPLNTIVLDNTSFNNTY